LDRDQLRRLVMHVAETHLELVGTEALESRRRVRTRSQLHRG
jgi:hypothetical protein